MKPPLAQAFHLKHKETNLRADIKNSLMSFCLSSAYKHTTHHLASFYVAIILFSWWLGFVERASPSRAYHLLNSFLSGFRFQGSRSVISAHESFLMQRTTRSWQWICACLMCGHVPSDDITCGSRACTRSAMFGILLTHAYPCMSERLKKRNRTVQSNNVLVFLVYSPSHIVFVPLSLSPPSSVTHSLGQCVRQPGLLPGAVVEVRTRRSALAVWNWKNKHNNHNLTPPLLSLLCQFLY